MSVSYRFDGTTALLTIDNPPVNVISHAVRQGLMDGLDRAEADGAGRVVIAGAGRFFVAGADATEFDKTPVAPHLPDVLNRIEAFPVPVIAALNGDALGGGVEIALACRYRIAAPGVTLALPEVGLGLVPGAGGTQRLPRLIGTAAALEVIVEGKSLSAAAAQEAGLVDALAEDLVQAAREVPDDTLAEALPARHRTAKADAEALDAARKKAAKAKPGQQAPLEAIALIGKAAGDFAEGLDEERRVFLELRGSDQARALRHVFFSERRAMGRGRTLQAKPGPLDSAIVVGGGNMGASIAYALAGAGLAVTLIETDAEGVERARANVAQLYDQGVKRGRITRAAAEAALASQVTFRAGYDDLPAADLAIEAAFEDMSVKQMIFAALDTALPESAILASNTSYLDVDALAQGVRRPERVLGLHFFSPAHIMKLLEIVRGAATSEATLATAYALAKRLGKIPVTAGVCDGFIGNRILTRYRQTTDILMLEGALPWQIDAAMRAFGFAMGPYEVQDLSGLDIAYANRKRQGLKDRADLRYIPIADTLVADMGRLGRKSGAGWYDHGESGPQPSAEVETAILAASDEAGVTRRPFTDAEIQSRALTAMIDEACRILDEGIAARPEDIDLVLIHGYAFPRWRGGPMHYADSLGPQALRDRISALAEDDPLSWSVPGLLERLARDDRSFASLNDI